MRNWKKMGGGVGVDVRRGSGRVGGLGPPAARRHTTDSDYRVDDEAEEADGKLHGPPRVDEGSLERARAVGPAWQLKVTPINA